MRLVDRARVAAVITVAAIVYQLAAARAQSAEAEVLFRDGRELVKQGQIAAGCDKLAASERLESSVGTLLNLGDCREKLGNLASAWAAFRKAEAMAKRAGGDDKRQGEARRRAMQLEPRLPSLAIEVPHRVDGLVVRRDGEIVDEAQWSTPLPVDPGSYTIVAEAPGYRAWRATVPVGLGAKRLVVVVPGLEPTPVATTVIEAARPPPPERPGSAAVPPAAVAPGRAGPWTTSRELSVGLALAGAGALGTAIYFGVHASTLQDRADRRCPLVVCADPEGLAFGDQAQRSATRANVLYLAGSATVAAAVVLWLVGAPDEPRVTPTVGGHQLGIAMTGRF